MFASVFEEMGQSLPLPTLMIVVTSGFLGRWWWAVLMGVPVAVFALVSFGRSAAGKRTLHTLAVRVPLAGPLTQRSEVAAFSRTLGTLLGSGLPIVTALHTTASTLRNVLYQGAVRTMSAGVREGAPLSQVLDSEALFPKMVSSIVAVGERSGDLSGCLLQMADEGERDIDRQVKIVMTLLEPLMIVLLGTVVGFIVIAMLLPIFMLGDTLQI